MDAWVPYAVREHCRDAVRDWAELEGKSPQMTEYLIETAAKPAADRLGAAFFVAIGIRVAAWALETFWYLSRR
jgi:hypothetical protein